MLRAALAYKIRIWRFAIGRQLMHLGLGMMPKSDARSELTALLWTWNMRVTATVAAQRAAEAGYQGEDD